MALRHGLYASFAPKPWPAGNGCHLHLSGWDRDLAVNRFHEEGGPGSLSDLERHVMAGVLGPVTSSADLTPSTAAISWDTCAARPTSVWIKMYAWITELTPWLDWVARGAPQARRGHPPRPAI